MNGRLIGVFSIEEERHTILQLGRSDHIAQKTLQWLEGELRNGKFPADARNLRDATIQCARRQDLRVKRWAINALAELGLGGDLSLLDEIFAFTDGDPDLLASAVRLLFREARGGAGVQLLNKQGVAVEGLALIAGSEYSAILQKRLVEEKIPLDHATDEELRAAIVLTGRGKAPNNLFFAEYSNEIALSELNQHDDPSVVKYSLWGLAERQLGFGYLKIDLADYDNCPPQVRKWMLRLLFSDENALSQNLDLIWHGAQDGAVEVREEAAIGLRRCYVEAAVTEIIRWYNNENEPLVLAALIEHMASFAVQDARYESLVTEIYSREVSRSELRGRIEACVVGTEMYRKFRSIELRDEVTTLFSNDNEIGAGLVPKIEQNFTNSNVTGVTGSGDVKIESASMQQNSIDPELVKDLVGKVIQFAAKIQDQGLANEGKELASELQEKPTKGVVEKLIGWVGLVSKGAKAGSDLITAGNELYEDLNGLAGNM